MLNHATLLGLAIVFAAGAPEDARHPVITEVLFNVPKGDAGDATGDGVRHSAGDEFVELFNGTTAPMELAGYTLTNRLTTGDQETTRGVRFRFPKFTLPPGGVVVVFNGCESDIEGPVGTASKAPKEANSLFGDAYVFTMDNRSRNRAFSNGGDFVLLSSPRGEALDAVTWGRSDPEPPEETVRVATVRSNPKGSVQRVTAESPMEAHLSIDGRACSPGELPPTPTGGE
jgi:hypothetical protein